MTDLLHDIGLARSGALLGLVLALGLVLVHQGLPRHRRATLDDRLAPYLRDTPRPSRLLAVDDVSLTAVIPAVLRPVVTDLAQRVERVLGGTASVRRRLLRAGRLVTVVGPGGVGIAQDEPVLRPRCERQRSAPPPGIRRRQLDVVPPRSP